MEFSYAVVVHLVVMLVLVLLLCVMVHVICLVDTMALQVVSKQYMLVWLLVHG